MIFILLLFVKSVCLFCQRLVLDVHDRWVNPKNGRQLIEASEIVGERRALQEQQSREVAEQKRARRAYQASQTALFACASAVCGGPPPEVEACRFCENTPQGFCRHHFHLQVLEVQKQKLKNKEYQYQPQYKKRKSKIHLTPRDIIEEQLQAQQKHEYRQLRRINRELKSNLKNRLNVQQEQLEHYNKYQEYKSHFYETPAPNSRDSLVALNDSFATLSSSNSRTSGYLSADLSLETPSVDCDPNVGKPQRQLDCESTGSAQTQTTILTTHL